MKQKNGISLIVLVVTIIVMIIIAGAIILSLNNTNVIDMAERGDSEWNISTVKEQLTVLKSNKLLENHSPEEALYGRFSKYGIDIGKMEDKILIEDGNLVYDSTKVTEEEVEYFKSKGIQESRHYVIVSEETKTTKYPNATNVGTYENFVLAVNAGEFKTSKDKDGNIVEAKYKIAYLDEDIDFGNHELEDGTWVDKDGNASTSIPAIVSFDGILDGQEHSLLGVYINRVGAEGFINYNEGIIKNIIVEGFVDAKSTLVKENKGIVDNCSIKVKSVSVVGGAAGLVTNNQKEGKILNCYNNSIAIKSGSSLAGIAVNNYGVIKRCINNADIYSSNSVGRVGGIVVINFGIVEECINNGYLDFWQNGGGIAVENKSIIKNCYNTGDLLNGWNKSGICKFNSEGTISNCYNIGNNTSSSGIGLTHVNISNSYSITLSKPLSTSYINCSYRTEEELKSDEQITLLNEGNSSEVWVKDTGNINNGYPILKWQLEN